MFLEAKDARDLADVAVTSDWSSLQAHGGLLPVLRRVGGNNRPVPGGVHGVLFDVAADVPLQHVSRCPAWSRRFAKLIADRATVLFTMTTSNVRALRREATIATILDRAVAVMAEHGVAGLTMTRLAEAMGIKPPSLYKWFPSVLGVYDAVFARGQQANLEAFRVRRGRQRARDCGPLRWADRDCAVGCRPPRRSPVAVLAAGAGLSPERAGHGPGRRTGERAARGGPHRGRPRSARRGRGAPTMA